MNTELIEKFFKTFEIEPISKKYECRCGTNSTQHTLETCPSKICDKEFCDQKETGVFYPNITSYQYLKLLAVMSTLSPLTIDNCLNNIDFLQEGILKCCIITYFTVERGKELIKKQIQQIFKED